MNTENMIEITGAKLEDVARAAYDLSSPQGLGIIHFEEGGLTDEQIATLIKNDPHFPLMMDYVKGRACKMTVYREGEKLFIDNQWYDHSDADLNELLSRISIEKPA